MGSSKAKYEKVQDNLDKDDVADVVNPSKFIILIR
jgi:hypothetical protein